MKYETFHNMLFYLTFVIFKLCEKLLYDQNHSSKPK